jgi:hypothetical protein
VANTVITIDIATAIRAAIAALTTLPDGTAVYARGVPTDIAGAVTDAAKCERAMPSIDIIPSERRPFSHASALHTYPVRIRAMSWFPDDQFQVTLYTLAQAVANWLATPPSLTLTLAHFDALVCSQEPTVGNFGDNDYGQYIEWQIEVKTRRST